MDTVKLFRYKREHTLKSDNACKSIKSAWFPALEIDVLSFVRVARSLYLPVNSNSIQIKARSFRTKHNNDAYSFSASRG